MDSDQLAELQNEVWFHGQISRAEAEKLLQNDGDFLVRESPNSDGQYVLSGMLENTKKHLLLIDPEGVVYYSIKDKCLVLNNLIVLGAHERPYVSKC